MGLGSRMSNAKSLAAEFIGTAFLLMAVVGSGIMGERLAAGNDALALLANSAATAGALVALILALGPHSGAHFNPVVSLMAAVRGDLSWPQLGRYVPVQILGAVAGVLLAHGMFEVPLAYGTHARFGAAQMLSESLATFGLILVIWTVSRQASQHVAYAVAAYILGAYWFTASTSFANPAVTLARALTPTFSGIRPEDVVGFLVAQVFGAGLAMGLLRWLAPEPKVVSNSTIATEP